MATTFLRGSVGDGLPVEYRFLLLMFVGFLPANVYAAVTRAPMGGHAWGPVYLLIRVPLQLVFITWSWWFAARQSPER